MSDDNVRGCPQCGAPIAPGWNEERQAREAFLVEANVRLQAEAERLRSVLQGLQDWAEQHGVVWVYDAAVRALKAKPATGGQP